MGYLDLKILADKLRENGIHFWGETLDGLSRVCRIWEEQTRQIAQLPIFGGRLQRECRTTKWMSLFSNDTPCLKLFKEGIRLAGQVFEDFSATRFDSTQTRKFEDTSLPNATKGVYTNVMHAVRRIQTRMLIEGTIEQPNYPMKRTRTLLHDECLLKQKGGNFAYKKLLEEERKTQKMEVAPAYFTWKNSINHSLTPKEWHDALELINKHKFSPRARWNSVQIFFRTLWTPLKDFKSYGQDHMGYCQLCNAWPADTRHIVFDCTIAQKIWNCVMEILSKVFDKNISFNEHHILFHANIKDVLKSGVLIAAKSAIISMHNKKILAPVHNKVTAAFLRTHLLLLCDTYIRNAPDDDGWLMLRKTVHEKLDKNKRITEVR